MSLRQISPTFRRNGLCWRLGCFTQVLVCVVHAAGSDNKLQPLNPRLRTINSYTRCLLFLFEKMALVESLGWTRSVIHSL